MKIDGRRMQARGIVNFCQRSGAYLHLELRGQGPVFYLEPGSIPVRSRFAREAIDSGWLRPAGFDLLGTPASWTYSGPQPRTPKIHPDFRGPAIGREKTDAPMQEAPACQLDRNGD